MFALTRLALSLALPACATVAPAGRVAVDVAPATRVAPPYARDVRSVVVSSVELAAPRESSPCRLRMRTVFHLRARPVPMSVGPEIAAGTEVEVTAMSRLQRSVHGPDQPYNEVFVQMRLVERGATGYAFIHGADLSSACRVSPDERNVLPSLEARLAAASRRRFAARGVFPLPNQPLRGGFERGRDTVIERLDADGDGTRDAVLLLRTQGRDGAFVLRRQTAQGWAAADLIERVDHDHFSSGYTGTVRIGGALYFRTEGWGMGVFTRYWCGRVALNDDDDSPMLLRLHPSGDLIPVLIGPWTLGDDGAVRVGGARHHFDEARFAFVPDDPAPGLPRFDPEGDQCPEAMWAR